MTGLALRELRLSHYRSHKFAQLQVGPQPIALFGANGAGKTNILEAISMLSPGRGLRRATPDDMARKPEAVGWKITAVLDSLGRRHEIETWAEPGTSRQVRIDGKTAAQSALGQLARILWLVPSMDRLWMEGTSERRGFLDRIAMSFEPTHGETTLAYEKARRERNRLLKDQVRDDSWFASLEAQLALHGAKINTNRQLALERLASAQTGAQTAFPQADLSLTHPDDTGEISEEVYANARRMDFAAGRTRHGPHRADLLAVYAAKKTEARLCSTGEQKALLVSLILSNARALAEDFGAPPILLLDEVAAHLDQDRRAALYDEVCALGTQAWLTGTGAELFAELDKRAQHFEVSDGEDGSRIEEIT